MATLNAAQKCICVTSNALKKTGVEYLEIEMNEHIKELAVKAKILAEEDINKQISYNQQLETFAEKFAELIVQECASIIQKEVSLKYKDGGETEEFMGGHYAGSVLARVKIKHHFGVK
jgi:hypothetical protein